MGYDISQLCDESTVDDELVCKVCYGVLEKPRSMCAEGHPFCHSCWCQWLERKRTCPTCRSSIDEATPLIKNRLAERMVGELMSHCPFREAARRPAKRQRATREDDAAAPPERGCSWRGKLRDLEAHTEVCEFALKTCSMAPLCSVSLPRAQIAEHERTCPHLRTLCVRCGRLVRVDALRYHQKSSKCHRAQALLADYLALLRHTASCVDATPLPGEGPAHTLRLLAAGRSRTCDRADCHKMETLLRHFAKCSSREEAGTCPSGICDHIKLLLELHSRDCTARPFCPVPFCMQWRAAMPATTAAPSS